MQIFEGNMPRWLEKANELLKYGNLEHFTMDMLQIDVKDLLKDSCFYLSAGADITPIVAFKDFIFSYILCDKDLVCSIQDINNKFNGILLKLKDKLIQQGFTEKQKFNLDRHKLGINDRHYEGGYVESLQNCEISFWIKENKFYSIVYINYDNSFTYIDLYLKNDIVPKAICEILPDGGSLNDTDENKYGKFKPEEKKKIMPELVLGHLDSIGDREKYERITDKVEYFGDYSWSSENLFIYKKKEN